MVDKERVGRFLRVLLGLLTVGWLFVAVVAPPDPFTFLVWLVPVWLLAFVAAAALEDTDGYRHLRASPLYAPGVKASKATGAFVLLTLALKLALTFAADSLLGAAAVGYEEGVVVGLLAFVLAYVVVFVVGAVSWVYGARSGS